MKKTKISYQMKTILDIPYRENLTMD